MLKRNYDWVVLGQNLASLTLGQHLLTQKKAVLVLNDRRFIYGGPFENYISFIPKESFKYWVEGHGLPPSVPLDSFLSPANYHLSFGPHLISLGGRPYQNLRELFRKAPFLFVGEGGGLDQESYGLLQELLGMGDNFDQEILQIGPKVASMFGGLRARKFPSFNEAIEEAPFFFKKLFLLFLRGFKEATQKASHGDAAAWEKLVFYFLANSFHHKKLALPESELELFFLLAGLLMPASYLDGPALLKELSANFVAQGGHIRDSQVLQVMGRPHSHVWGLELDTYDGIVHPENLVMAGGPVSAQPFGGPVFDVCQFVQIEVNVSAPVDTSSERQIFYYGNTACMGQDSPLIILEIHGPAMRLNIPVRKSLGLKESFIEKDLLQVIESLVQWPVDASAFLSQIRKGEYHLTEACWPIGPMEKVFQETPATPALKSYERGHIKWEKWAHDLHLGARQLLEREGGPRTVPALSGYGGHTHGLSLVEAGELGQLSILVHLAQLLS